MFEQLPEGVADPRSLPGSRRPGKHQRLGAADKLRCLDASAPVDLVDVVFRTEADGQVHLIEWGPERFRRPAGLGHADAPEVPVGVQGAHPGPVLGEESRDTGCAGPADWGLGRQSKARRETDRLRIAVTLGLIRHEVSLGDLAIQSRARLVHKRVNSELASVGVKDDHPNGVRLVLGQCAGLESQATRRQDVCVPIAGPLPRPALLVARMVAAVQHDLDPTVVGDVPQALVALEAGNIAREPLHQLGRQRVGVLLDVRHPLSQSAAGGWDGSVMECQDAQGGRLSAAPPVVHERSRLGIADPALVVIGAVALYLAGVEHCDGEPQFGVVAHIGVVVDLVAKLGGGHVPEGCAALVEVAELGLVDPLAQLGFVEALLSLADLAMLALAPGDIVVARNH